MSNKSRSVLVGIVVSALLLTVLFWGLDWGVSVVHFSNIRVLPVLAIVLFLDLALYSGAALAISSAKSVCPLYLESLQFRGPWLFRFGCFAAASRRGDSSLVVLSEATRAVICSYFCQHCYRKSFRYGYHLDAVCLDIGDATSPPFLLLGAYSLGLLALVLVIVTVVAYVKPTVVLWFVKKAAEIVTWRKAAGIFKLLEAGLGEFLSGLRSIASGKELFISIFWTVILWLEISIIYQLGMYAMGETAGVEIGIALCVVIALAVAAPSAPGFLGTFQLGCSLALTTLYGFDQEFAMSYSIVMHALQFIATVVFGLFALQAEGLRFSQLVRSKE